MQKQAAHVYMDFKKYHHMALVGLWHINEELRKGFSKFSNKQPKHLNKKGVKIVSSKPYLKRQLLRYACFPKDFCS